MAVSSASERELLIATRRDLHRHPELGYQEHRTAAIVAERLAPLASMSAPVIAETGVVATLDGAGPGPTLLLRADMDALPIQEECEHDFISTTPGRMHACGHDAHVAIGLAVAERLARARATWTGSVRYVFQPAEEGGGGALRMIEQGALDGVDAAMGLHIWLGLPSGTVGVVEGPFMAGSQDFRIDVQGRGGHGAIPHETVDATLTAAHLVVALQSIVARNVAPLDTAVISVGMLNAGSSSSIIASTAEIRGTIRSFSEDLAAELRRHIERVTRGVCDTFGARFSLAFGEKPYPPTVNDPALTRLVREAAMGVVGEDRLRTGDAVRTMAAEDFSEFGRRVPACYFFVGGRNEKTGAIHPHHSPRFDLCEDALPVAVDVLERSALAFLRT
jgi:amidohydrolase